LVSLLYHLIINSLGIFDAQFRCDWLSKQTRPPSQRGAEIKHQH
jgi:hypothetical protein